MTDSLPAAPPLRPVPDMPLTANGARLRDAAMQIESLFLAEMLKSAGAGAAPGAFGGGIGEEQFSSFLIEAQAREMARAGGIGLAETLYRSLAGRADGR